VWAHFAAELAAGVRDRYPQSTAATNQVMLLIDAEGNQVSELARRAGVTKQAMAQTVEQLEALGMVSRRPDPDDRRAKLVTLTPAGWDALRHGLAVANAIHVRWTELLGEGDMRRLVALLERLAGRLDQPR
jgi:DNA-binding MarR family transcriptional regulator